MKVLDSDVALLAPGGAYLAAIRTLLVADLHAGYVPTLQRRGYTLPTQGDEALHERLRAMFARVDVARVVVAGDLVHGVPALLRRGGERAPFDVLLDVLDGRALTVVPGNHDRDAHELFVRRGVAVTERAVLGAHVVLHGDEANEQLARERACAIERGGVLFVGHHHPALTLDDGVGTRRRVAAFVYAPGLVCLPALAPLARGACLLRDDRGEGLTALAPEDALSVAVVVGTEVIPVGTLARVQASQRSPRRARRTP